MTRPSHAHPHAHRDRGASAVEYGLLVAGIVATFLVAAVGLQTVVGAVLSATTSNIEKQDAPAPAATP